MNATRHGDGDYDDCGAYNDALTTTTTRTNRRACMRACVPEHGTARIYDDDLDEAAPLRRQLTTLTTTMNATRHGDGDYDDCGAVPRRPNHDDHAHEQACVHARVRA